MTLLSIKPQNKSENEIMKNKVKQTPHLVLFSHLGGKVCPDLATSKTPNQ